MSFEKFFPSTMRESEDFSVFIKLANNELSTIQDTITLMETLTNIDRTPSEFVKSIGSIIGFTYVDSYDENVQRECIKSVWEARKEIGTHHALVMAATYGDIDGYLGGDLFIPGTFTNYNSSGEEIPVEPEPTPDPDESEDDNSIVDEEPVSKETYFTWSHSTWSGSSKYAGPNINQYELGGKKTATANTTFTTKEVVTNVLATKEVPRENYVEAVVILPREYLFRWSNSKWSSNHKFAGPVIYKEGIILIELTRLNEKIQRRVESVKPAGMQVVYKYIHNNKEEIITYLK